MKKVTKKIGGIKMKKLIWIKIAMIILGFSMDLKSANAQEIRDLFNKVYPSVVVIRTLHR